MGWVLSVTWRPVVAERAALSLPPVLTWRPPVSFHRGCDAKVVCHPQAGSWLLWGAGRGALPRPPHCVLERADEVLWVRG